jgi:hypothetical protein
MSTEKGNRNTVTLKKKVGCRPMFKTSAKNSETYGLTTLTCNLFLHEWYKKEPYSHHRQCSDAEAECQYTPQWNSIEIENWWKARNSHA